jgi:hypothetical protein
MPNQRLSGTKLAGAYISEEKDQALARIALQKGYPNKAEYIRALYDAALAEALTQSPTKARSAAKAGTPAPGKAPAKESAAGKKTAAACTPAKGKK